MFYIDDLGAHELHGPFLSRVNAHVYAAFRVIGAYQILPEEKAKMAHEPYSLRLVPANMR